MSDAAPAPSPDSSKAVAETWWSSAGLHGPFTPGKATGSNDGMVRDASGEVVADCRGVEARADVIASLLNAFANGRPCPST